MAGQLRRPESRNQLVRHLIGIQCRFVDNENDATLERDLLFAIAEAKRMVDPETVDVILEMAQKCMTSCNLNRYADRKQPCIFIYNLASRPMARSQVIMEEAHTMKSELLVDLVCSDVAKRKVNQYMHILNVDRQKLFQDEEKCEAFQAALKSALAAEAGDGFGPEHVRLSLEGGPGVLSTFTPTGGTSAADLRAKLRTSAEGLQASVGRAAAAAAAQLGVASQSGPVHVSKLNEPRVVSDRSEAIWHVCLHSAWSEQNMRDFTGAQGGAITGTNLGYKRMMQEGREIVEKFTPLMGFDD